MRYLCPCGYQFYSEKEPTHCGACGNTHVIEAHMPDGVSIVPASENVDVIHPIPDESKPAN